VKTRNIFQESLSYCFLCFLLMIFIGCSGDGNDKQNPPGNEPIGKSEPQQMQNKQSGFDLSKLKMCELVKDEMVANALGAKIVKPAQTSDFGPSHGCTYTLDPAGKDNLEICIVWINPASTYTGPQDELETAKSLGQEATVENLEGMGDKAFVVHNKTEDQSIIHVLLKDKMELQIGADHFDDAKKLTELYLSKLKNL
jgi:hypothetical protein